MEINGCNYFIAEEFLIDGGNESANSTSNATTTSKKSKKSLLSKLLYNQIPTPLIIPTKIPTLIHNKANVIHFSLSIKHSLFSLYFTAPIICFDARWFERLNGEFELFLVVSFESEILYFDFGRASVVSVGLNGNGGKTIAGSGPEILKFVDKTYCLGVFGKVVAVFDVLKGDVGSVTYDSNGIVGSPISQTKNPIITIPFSAKINSITISPSNDYITIACGSKLYLYTVFTPPEPATLKLSLVAIYSTYFGSYISSCFPATVSANLLLSSSQDDLITIYKLAPLNSKILRLTGSKSWINAMGILDGMVIAGGEDGRLYFWEGSGVKRKRGNPSVVNPNGVEIKIIGGTENVLVFGAHSRKDVTELPALNEFKIHVYPITYLAVFDDLFVSLDKSGNVKVWKRFEEEVVDDILVPEHIITN
ncbi:hypothetical protein HK098_007100 [Nowakowskiella sp. JEL0407]|nr:hypothetical protein HK098_007100 [Nowakowskiella sp. JEL0407]